MQLTLGEMLYRFRMERNVESRQVCHGICSPATISNMENGERVPDTLMFECFMERMGISPTQFSIMVTEDESKYLEWKNQVWDAIEKENWDELGNLLQSKLLKKTYCNKKLENQFIMYANGIYAAKKGNYAKAAEYLKLAAEQTIPEPEGVIEEQALLGELEISILMLYLYYGIKGKVISQPQGLHLFDILERYVYSDAVAVENAARCYPKLVCIGVHVLEMLTEEEKRTYLEKAIHLSKRNKTFHDLTEVLRLYVSMLEKSEERDRAFYKKHHEVFVDLLEIEGLSMEFKPEIVIPNKAKYYILQEFLISKRKELGLTQGEISVGICEPETYSRVERGKRAPSRKNMQQLSERLGISWNYYRGEIYTTNPRAFELRRMHRVAGVEGRMEEERELLNELELLLDMEVVENRQYVESCKCILKYKLGLKSAEQVYAELHCLINLTQVLDEDISNLKYYSQTELEILGQMAMLLDAQQKYEEAIQLILPMFKQMWNSKIGVKYQWNSFDYILRILARLYFRVKDYETGLYVANYIRSEKVRRREADTIVFALNEIANDLYGLGTSNRTKSEKMYRYSYYLADFFELGIKEKTRIIYEEKFGEIEWYATY